MGKFCSIGMSCLMLANGVLLTVRTLNTPINLQTVYTGKMAVAVADALISAAALGFVNTGLLIIGKKTNQPWVRQSSRIWIISLVSFALLFGASDVYATRKLHTAERVVVNLLGA